MAAPKITVIGAGSYFFGRPIIWKMATSEVMSGGSLALVDTNPRILETMMEMASRVFAHTGNGIKLTGSTDRRQVMGGSDFIVLTFSERNAWYRGVDTRIAAKHGIRMCSSDSIGPGGIFRAMREIPTALAVARDAEELSPEAWLINFVNPSAVLGIALMRHAQAMKTFSLCDGLHEPYHTLGWLRAVGILTQEDKSIPPAVLKRLDLAIGGVNHFTWVFRFVYDGKDMLPALRERLMGRLEEEGGKGETNAKERYNHSYTLQLLDLYGAYPTRIDHTKEYLPFFQGYGISPNYPEPIRLFDAEERATRMEASFKINAQYASGELSPEHFIGKVRADHATDVIESMWGDMGKRFYINCPNQGAIGNLADDAFLESLCDVDMQGVRPHHIGDFPRGLLGLQQQVLDTHELTVEAAVSGNRALLRRAMLSDPICNNIGDADACIEELLAAEEDALPGYWYR